MENNGWAEYKLAVLYRLDSLKEDIKDLGDRLEHLESEMTNMKIKSGVWGAIGASLPIALGILWQLVGK